MTAVVSNLGNGPIFAGAHETQYGRIDATLSAPALTVSWIAMTAARAETFAVALGDLVDQIDTAVNNIYAELDESA